MAEVGPPLDADELIGCVCAATGADLQSAAFILEAYNWNAGNAIAALIDENQPEMLIRPPSPPSPSSPEMADSRKSKGFEDDPIGTFCELTGQCREAGLFYLEGFKWILDAAVEGFHNNVLPPIDDNISPHLPSDFDMAIDKAFGYEPSPAAPKRSRSPPLKSEEEEEGSFTFPKLEASSDFGDRPLDKPKVVSAYTGKAVKVLALAASPANTSHGDITEMKDDDMDDEASGMEISSAPTPESLFPIQLADGTDIFVTFGSRDRIRDIRDYIDSLRPGDPKGYKLLTKGSNQRELTDLDQTVEDAGIIGSSLIQEYRDSSTPSSGKLSVEEAADSPVTGLIQDPSVRAITLFILLSDGNELDLSLTRDKTIRDIHDRIDEIRPDDNKTYHFLDCEARELRDLDQTIEEAALAEPRLLQVCD